MSTVPSHALHIHFTVPKCRRVSLCGNSRVVRCIVDGNKSLGRYWSSVLNVIVLVHIVKQPLSHCSSVLCRAALCRVRTRIWMGLIVLLVEGIWLLYTVTIHTV